MLSRKQTSLAATVCAVALLAFVAIAYVYKQATLLPLDLAVTQRIHGPDRFIVSQLVELLTDMGGSVLVFLILQIAVLLGIRRQWGTLTLWLGATGSGFILNVLLKQILQRQRPHLEDMTILEQSTGFPSGHAMMALLTYGLLAYGLAPRLRQPWQRAALVGGLALLVALIGYSRMYVGAHYFSDILGGYAAGLFWLTLCITLDSLGHTHGIARRQSAVPAGEVSEP
jgi:undecaprenyl-diphosphatase